MFPSTYKHWYSKTLFSCYSRLSSKSTLQVYCSQKMCFKPYSTFDSIKAPMSSVCLFKNAFQPYSVLILFRFGCFGHSFPTTSGFCSHRSNWTSNPYIKRRFSTQLLFSHLGIKFRRRITPHHHLNFILRTVR